MFEKLDYVRKIRLSNSNRYLNCNRKISGDIKNEIHNVIKFYEAYFKNILSSFCLQNAQKKLSPSKELLSCEYYDQDFVSVITVYRDSILS